MILVVLSIVDTAPITIRKWSVINNLSSLYNYIILVHFCFTDTEEAETEFT